MPAGDLGFSVTVFIVCAILCIGTLQARRVAYGAELGTKMRWPTFALLVSLWLAYVVLSSLKAYKLI